MDRFNKTDTHRNTSNRREFLKSTTAGVAALIGSSLLGPGGWMRPENSKGAESGNGVIIKTHEWLGDIDERLDFPSGWQIKKVLMAGHDAPVLSDDDILARIRFPIGTKPLRELAEGKKKVVITFDDMTRPTQTYRIAPVIVQELRQAGVPEEGILFLGSFGCHMPLVQMDVEKKLGRDIVRNYQWLDHNPFEHLTEVGTTKFGNIIKVNHHFAGAELRICISGVKQHSWAGYGGGSKAILPGVSWINSIDYNHRAVIGVPNHINPTTGVGKIYKNEARADMNEAARLAQVDFSVQVIYNGNRDTVAVYAGDIVEAHRAACHYAVRHYQTNVLKNADVVVCNSYPQNQQAHNNWAIANNSLREGGTVVMVVQSPTGTYPLHYWDERRNFVGRPYWDAPTKRPGFPVKQAGMAIYFSQYLQKRNMNEYDSNYVKFAFSWEEVLKLLRQRHTESTTVAVYPYAPLQHEPLELDET